MNSDDLWYWYRGTVTDVYDGDTITINLRLGFNFRVDNFKVRMAGINAPEMKGPTKPAGTASRDALRHKLMSAVSPPAVYRDVLIHTSKDRSDKYGPRYDAIVWLEETVGAWINVNQWMIDNSFAVPFMEPVGALSPRVDPAWTALPKKVRRK